MNPVVLALPGNEAVAKRLAERLTLELGRAELRRFPDGESYVRIDGAVKGGSVIVICTLDRPDEKFLPLTFLAATARDCGAARVGLVCPYLAYMRQDMRFRDGEGVTSSYFASAISKCFDWLVTIDPHLHRRASLSEIYSIPAIAVHAATRLADWIREYVPAPLVIGPDAESEQWVSAVADSAQAPYVVLEKVRLSDREVQVSLPKANRWRERMPVLVDDIISSARTMIAAARRFREAGLRQPLCVGVHAIFADRAYEELIAAGVAGVVTCNTVPHISNQIDITDLLEAPIRNLLRT
ncbi:MAG TPA: ribose-phosphate pyrophosphokinase [Alphaproteobacteria bacterium]|nr:ribose-phosphate pyrophosphokinase [Alphaproteobacteria bacterium]